jgi:hypothetical protein
MMYQNKLVACIKVNGKILRENKDFVNLPFGSEYSVLIKNLNSVRCEVKLSIDGADATGPIILNPNTNVELERFVNGNLTRGNRFKFIERTQAVEDHRGVKAEDGIVRIEYAFEKVVKHETTVHHHQDIYHYTRPYYDYWGHYIGNNGWGGNIGQGYTWTGSTAFNTSGTVNSNSMGRTATGATRGLGSISSNSVSAKSVNDSGITVPGSISNQKFVTVSSFETEQSEVIVLYLKGYISTNTKGEEKKVEVPVVVEKVVCPSCGKKNKQSHQFCSACGTGLKIV